MNPFFENLLDHPLPYKITQHVFAPGHRSRLTRYIQEVLARLPRADELLDVGCGPASWLWEVDQHPVGLDVSENYREAWVRRNERYTLGSADKLPFGNSSFGGIWSVFLFHHLTDDQVRATLAEMLRVGKKGGYVSVLDGIMPDTTWSNPLATWIRRNDRGRYMRKQEHLESLFPDRPRWNFERRTYALNGLELVAATRVLT